MDDDDDDDDDSNILVKLLGVELPNLAWGIFGIVSEAVTAEICRHLLTYMPMLKLRQSDRQTDMTRAGLRYLGALG